MNRAAAETNWKLLNMMFTSKLNSAPIGWKEEHLRDSETSPFQSCWDDLDDGDAPRQVSTQTHRNSGVCPAVCGWFPPLACWLAAGLLTSTSKRQRLICCCYSSVSLLAHLDEVLVEAPPRLRVRAPVPGTRRHLPAPLFVVLFSGFVPVQLPMENYRISFKTHTHTAFWNDVYQAQFHINTHTIPPSAARKELRWRHNQVRRANIARCHSWLFRHVDGGLRYLGLIWRLT